MQNRDDGKRPLVFGGDHYIPKMNVSREADEEFMRLLEIEDPKRCENLRKSIRRSSGCVADVDQALTNLMLGLPTLGHNFEVIAGPPAPSPMEPSVTRPKKGGRPRKYKTAKARKRALRERVRQCRARLRSAGCNENLSVSALLSYTSSGENRVLG